MKIAATYEKETGNVFQHFGKMLCINIPNHKSIPILDSEVAITYHFAILKANREQLLPVIQRISGSQK